MCIRDRSDVAYAAGGWPRPVTAEAIFRITKADLAEVAVVPFDQLNAEAGMPSVYRWGQVFYDASRKLILKGVDGVVFVADSQIERMEANIESLENLRLNLTEQGYDLDKLPYVVQYNKRDLPNAAPLDQLKAVLNPTKAPEFEACATSGVGVFDTLKAVAKAVLRELQRGSQSST